MNGTRLAARVADALTIDAGNPNHDEHGRFASGDADTASRDAVRATRNATFTMRNTPRLDKLSQHILQGVRGGERGSKISDYHAEAASIHRNFASQFLKGSDEQKAHNAAADAHDKAGNAQVLFR